MQAFGLAVLWPLMMATTGAVTYLAVVHASTISRATHMSFAPTLIVTGVNICGSLLVKMTVDLEAWPPSQQNTVWLFQSFSVNNVPH